MFVSPSLDLFHAVTVSLFKKASNNKMDSTPLRHRLPVPSRDDYGHINGCHTDECGDGWLVTCEYVRSRSLKTLQPADPVRKLAERLRTYAEHVSRRSPPDLYFHRKSQR